MKKVGIILLILLSFSFETYAGFALLGNAKSVKIPVEIQNNLILVPLRINGSFEMNFILDTGVRTTILTETLVSTFLSLDSLETVRVRGLGEGNIIEAALARKVSIDLPGVIGRGMRLIILPPDLVSYSGMFGKPVYGIIGHALFSQFVVEINYRNKYIRLYDPFKYKKKIKGTSFPIYLDRGKPYIKAHVTTEDGGEMYQDWLIDTGASRAVSLFSSNIAIPEPNVESFLGKGLNGNVYGRMAKIPSFRMGDFRFDDIIAGFPDSTSLGGMARQGWYGNIGAEIISRFRVYFHYLGYQVVFRRNGKSHKPFAYNHCGVEVVAKGENFDEYQIIYVRPGSPAEEIGVRVDDQLLSINGSSTQKMEIGDIYRLFTSKVGKRMTLKVKRGREIEKYRFTLSEIF